MYYSDASIAEREDWWDVSGHSMLQTIHNVFSRYVWFTIKGERGFIGVSKFMKNSYVRSVAVDGYKINGRWKMLKNGFVYVRRGESFILKLQASSTGRFRIAIVAVNGKSVAYHK